MIMANFERKELSFIMKNMNNRFNWIRSFAPFVTGRV